MATSEDLYRTLTGFRSLDSSSATPEQALLRYCNEVLGAIEGMHVDYKQKRDRRRAKLDEDDKKNLAKAVSGFTNSGGGILVWGIEDKSISPKPIQEIQGFVSQVTELASQVTDPIAQGIQSHWIPADNDPSAGFGLIHIPESTLPPHRVVLKQEGLQGNYYIRSGSSFVVASHTQLEDMFGRRPKPTLDLSLRLNPGGSAGGRQHFDLVLGIQNSGRASARAPFLSVKVMTPYTISEYGIDGNRNFGLDPIARSHGSDEIGYGSSSTSVIHPGVTLDVAAVSLKIPFEAKPSEISSVEIKYRIAAENSQLVEGEREFTAEQIWDHLPKQSS